MEETQEKMSDEFKEKVEQKVVDKLVTNLDLTNAVTTYIARIEALNIAVNIFNAFLSERQKGENKLSAAELGAVQAAVNAENTRTEDLFKQIDSALNKKK